MISLVTTLSQRTKAPVSDLLFAFGKYIFQSFTKRYPEFLEASDSFFDFLESIEKYIHVEVRKLYPDAELPKFETALLDGKTLEMNYFSERKMGDFAMGLIESSMEYFGEKGIIDMNPKNDSGSEVQFIIKKLANQWFWTQYQSNNYQLITKTNAAAAKKSSVIIDNMHFDVSQHGILFTKVNSNNADIFSSQSEH